MKNRIRTWIQSGSWIRRAAEDRARVRNRGADSPEAGEPGLRSSTSLLPSNSMSLSFPMSLSIAMPMSIPISMSIAIPLSIAFGLLLPSTALADDVGPVVLSLKTGVPAELVSKSLSVAAGLFPFALILGLLVEAFGGSPDQPKRYGAVAWRALVVVAVLFGYRALFGSVITSLQGLADRIAPESVYSAFGQHNLQSIQALREQAQAEGDPESTLSGLLATGKLVKGYVGGALFDGLLLVLVTAGQAFHWAFQQLTRVLIALLYVVGPLALVFHIPAASGTAGRWLRNFVTVASWPVFSAILLALAASLLLRTDGAAVLGDYGTAFGALGTTLLMVTMCLAVPVLASAIIGGTIQNLPNASAVAAAMGAAKMARLADGGVAAVRGLAGSGPGAGSRAGPASAFASAGGPMAASGRGAGPPTVSIPPAGGKGIGTTAGHARIAAAQAAPVVAAPSPAVPASSTVSIGPAPTTPMPAAPPPSASRRNGPPLPASNRDPERRASGGAPVTPLDVAPAPSGLDPHQGSGGARTPMAQERAGTEVPFREHECAVFQRICTPGDCECQRAAESPNDVLQREDARRQNLGLPGIRWEESHD